LRWLGARLGEARDTDVLLARIRVTLDEVPQAHREPRELLLAPLLARRHTSRRNVRDTLRTGRYGELVDTLTFAAVRPPLRPGTGARATKALPLLVQQRW